MDVIKKNGREIYVFRLKDLTKEKKQDDNGLNLREAMDIAATHGWGLEMPNKAPKRAVCGCGKVYAREPDRNTCWECSTYDWDAICPVCKNEFTRNTKNTTCCGDPACKRIMERENHRKLIYKSKIKTK